MSSFSGYREALHLLVADVPKPGDEGMAGTASEHLLGCPEGIASGLRAYYRKLSEIDSGGG